MQLRKASLVLAMVVAARAANGADDTSAESIFYRELNLFRASPSAYQHANPGLEVRCSVPLNEVYVPLNVSTLLEGSALFQATTMSSNQCPVVSHETCAPYCAEMGGCGFETRIRYFLGGAIKHHNPLEVLIQGPKNPVKAFHMFLASKEHCNHILNCHINMMGAALVRSDKNILVADLAYVEA